MYPISTKTRQFSDVSISPGQDPANHSSGIPSEEHTHSHAPFTFRWPGPAQEVYVTGTFDNWSKSVKLEEVNGIFTKTVSLPQAYTVFQYIVDGIESLQSWETEGGVVRTHTKPRVMLPPPRPVVRFPPPHWMDAAHEQSSAIVTQHCDQIPGTVTDINSQALSKRPFLPLQNPALKAFKQTDQSQMNDIEESPAIDFKLDRILSGVDNESAWQLFKSHGISDLWFPFTKQTLQKVFSSNRDRNCFLEAQDSIMDTEIKVWNDNDSKEAHAFHSAIDDDEDLVKEHRMLGEGAFGTVEEISIVNHTKTIKCVRKRIGRPRHLKAQKQIMAAFAREIKVMRQVEHQHCVQFLGSYTDIDHVNILSNPVADMDLATMLDRPILFKEAQFLYRGIGCLCNALSYLHRNNIRPSAPKKLSLQSLHDSLTRDRHEDLKPQNVLIHGDNILLTDFGFSLDFSDDSISTTTGRPAAWTIRYSAPEVLNFEPRNRATDIFSLGCILLEMISSIYGHSLTALKEFWKHTGNGQSSFARNPEAKRHWMVRLQQSSKSAFNSPQLDMLCRYSLSMLHPHRLYRPTAQQVVDHLSDISITWPHHPIDGIATCKGLTPCIGLSNYNPALRNYSSNASLLVQFSMAAYYFYPIQYTDWTYELYDMDHNFIGKKPDLHGENHNYFSRSCYITICAWFNKILEVACKTGTTKDFWHTQEQRRDNRFSTEEAHHAHCSIKLHSLQHAIFSRVFLLENTVQITLLSICLPRSPYYGSFFWMLSYPIDVLNGITVFPHGLIVDLTTGIRQDEGWRSLHG
ncbi:kinase-like domain-containing protein [Phaeosphaeriaceae sp. PMI808]|nr:kinase-like domain-containing protein [Phaeosphaeriaceae sp. PMI808]